MAALCRDCFAGLEDSASRCSVCGSPRLRRHPELLDLAIAHMDCDAFYAAIEKRDNPALRDKPVIVGGGRRGVVSTACYIARLSGVHSAMPMFKALRACPHAVVIRPDMAKYAAVGREVRRLMLETTPLVEPLSLDEAFLDLAGTARLHRHSPAETLMRLARRIEDAVGITVSIGLSYCKFLAKLGSDLDKPRGFAVIGRKQATEFLRERPIGNIWGVGKAMRARLEADGLFRIGQLQSLSREHLTQRYGAIGQRLHDFSRGIDERKVDPDGPSRSISAETTFDRDLDGLKELEAELWPLCEKLSRRLKQANLAARTLTLKLKSASFKSITRSHTLPDPTQLAETIFQEARKLLARETDGTAYRLIGIGAHQSAAPEDADRPTLLDPQIARKAELEKAMEALRAKFGRDTVLKGRAIDPRKR